MNALCRSKAARNWREAPPRNRTRPRSLVSSKLLQYGSQIVMRIGIQGIQKLGTLIVCDRFLKPIQIHQHQSADLECICLCRLDFEREIEMFERLGVSLLLVERHSIEIRGSDRNAGAVSALVAEVEKLDPDGRDRSEPRRNSSSSRHSQARSMWLFRRPSKPPRACPRAAARFRGLRDKRLSARF